MVPVLFMTIYDTRCLNVILLERGLLCVFRLYQKPPPKLDGSRVHLCPDKTSYLWHLKHHSQSHQNTKPFTKTGL